MLIVMKQGATAEQIQRVCDRIREIGYTPHEIPGSIRTAVGITGNPGAVSPDHFQDLDGVAECVPISKPYKLVSREVKPEPTIIDVRGAKVGDGGLHIMAGPCSVESRDQILRTAEAVAASGAKFLRGGAYKPRTSPYAFQGMKEEGLRLLADVKAAFDLRIVTEVKDVESLAAVAEVADVVQIGARNMQNFALLKGLGKAGRPVLLKRGLSSTIKELLMSAEYIVAHGNRDVMLCERGIRTFETITRNTCDIVAVPVLQELTHLPVILDPSHATGKRSLVPSLSRAGVAIGADGIIVEVHPCPEKAVSDGAQSLTIDQFTKMMKDLGPYLDLWRGARVSQELVSA